MTNWRHAVPRIPLKKRRATSHASKPPAPEGSRPDAPQAAYPLSLTAALVRSLEEEGGPCAVFDDIAGRLRRELQDDVSFGGSADVWTRPIWWDAARVDAAAIALKLERAGLRRIIVALQRAVEQRETLGDLWPEGLLNAGIAYAAIGDYAKARNLLEQALERFSGRGVPAEGSAA